MAEARRFVFLRSVKAAAEQTAPDSLLTECDPAAPEDAYGVSKKEAEEMVKSAVESAGLEWMVNDYLARHG